MYYYVYSTCCKKITDPFCVTINKAVIGKISLVVDSLHDHWHMYCISRECAIPNNDHNHVAIKCNSYQTTNRQIKKY